MKMKYPRTPHLPSSQGFTSDDKVLKSIYHLIGKRVVVTEKRDGENTTMGRDYIHARSLDSKYHVSRDWVKSLWANTRCNIPSGWRICGENLYATHSIHYDELETYFEVFSVWDGMTCLSWDDTELIMTLVDLQMVPVLFRGVYEGQKFEDLLDLNKQEGYVIRIEDGFKYEDFGTSVAKWVRKGHVQSDDHWMNKKVIPNELKTTT